MTPRELEIANLKADLADQVRSANREPPSAQIIPFVPRAKQPAPTGATRAQTEAEFWAKRHRDGDDCA